MVNIHSFKEITPIFTADVRDGLRELAIKSVNGEWKVIGKICDFNI